MGYVSMNGLGVVRDDRDDLDAAYQREAEVLAEREQEQQAAQQQAYESAVQSEYDAYIRAGGTPLGWIAMIKEREEQNQLAPDSLIETANAAIETAKNVLDVETKIWTSLPVDTGGEVVTTRLDPDDLSISMPYIPPKDIRTTISVPEPDVAERNITEPIVSVRPDEVRPPIISPPPISNQTDNLLPGTGTEVIDTGAGNQIIPFTPTDSFLPTQPAPAETEQAEPGGAGDNMNIMLLIAAGVAAFYFMRR